MSDLPKQNEETYLGDGLYASFDGYSVVLRAPREGGDHFVGLEPVVYQVLRQWIRRYPRLAVHMKGDDVSDSDPYCAIPCPCGAKVCKNWLVEPVAAIQGVAFTRAQAEFVAAVLNLAAINGEEILSTGFLTAALKAINTQDRTTLWRPIETAPRSAGLRKNRYVLVRGPSTYAGPKHFVVLAYHDDQYRPLDPWRLLDNSALSDFGWVPEEWMEIPE